MKFLGQLFLRRLVSHKILRAVTQRLVLESERPEEHYVECLCELVRNTGAALEAAEAGKALLGDLQARMVQLAKMDYPKRIIFQIQHVIELQQNGWEERLHSEKAKTKEEVRQ